jgi:hypothetical protein
MKNFDKEIHERNSFGTRHIITFLTSFKNRKWLSSQAGNALGKIWMSKYLSWM